MNNKIMNNITKKQKNIQQQFLGEIQQYYQSEKLKFLGKDFDLLNRKILYLLYNNARYTPTQLAKFLKTNRETIIYRLEKMHHDGIIGGFFTLINHEALGLREYRVFFKLKTIGEEKLLITLLSSLKTVVTINICTGSYDLVVAFWIKDDKEFLSDFQQIMDSYHHLITHFDVVVGLERNLIGGMKYLLNQEELNSIPVLRIHKGSTFSKELKEKREGKDNKDDKGYIIDNIDKKILAKINLDAAIAIHELAKELSLTPITVKKRIKALITADVIRTFVPVVYVSKLGYHWWYFLIKCVNINHKTFLTFLKQHKNITWYIRLLGKWDYLLSVYARDNAECHKVIAELRTTFANNILYYDVLVLFNQLKYVQRIE